MAKAKKDHKAATASDAQVAAIAEEPRALVADVRAEMGPKHSWPKPKKEKS